MADGSQGMTPQQMTILRRLLAGNNGAALSQLLGQAGLAGAGAAQEDPPRFFGSRFPYPETEGPGLTPKETENAVMTAALPYLPADAQRMLFFWMKWQEAQSFQPSVVAAQEAGGPDGRGLIAALLPLLPARDRELLAAVGRWLDWGKD